jgi:uncharacterized protein YkwD
MFQRVLRDAVLAATFAGLAVVSGVALPGAAAELAAPHPRTAQEARIARAVVRTLDVERRRAGRRALHVRADLQDSARRHDLAMSRVDVLSHRLPGEPAFTARIRAAGYHWRWAGENIAWNSATTRRGALQLEHLMFSEKPPNDEHRVNILNRDYRDVGVDVYLDTRHHRLWLTTDFGRR